jgi:hypothetical protein
MIAFLVVMAALAVLVFFVRPSKYLFGVVNREFNPTPQEQEQRFYRRGHTYNAIGGLKGTHAYAFVWALMVVLPLAIVSAIFEAIFDAFGSARGRRRTPLAETPSSEGDANDDPPLPDEPMVGSWRKE